MILADKIMNLRKRNGWSQEELAERLQVSRQAVSKWESAQSVPDLEKILALSRLFGVTTDYLLKDEIEDEELIEQTSRSFVKRVSLSLAGEYLEWRAKAAKRIAAATFLCILSVIPLLLLGAASETKVYAVSENFAAGAGLVVLLILVAAAVAIFISCGFKNSPFEFIDKQSFENERGVEIMVREKQKAYRPTYSKINIIAACLCVLSPIPLFVGMFVEKEFLLVAMLSLTLIIAGIGSALFILVGVRFASMQKLLKEGDYERRNERQNRIKEAFSTVFWLIATAVYLIWSFVTSKWELTWIVWTVAAVLYAGAMCICNLIVDKNTDRY